MFRPDQRLRARRRLGLITVAAVLAFGGTISATSVAAAEPAKILLDWDQYAIEALSNMPTAPTPAPARRRQSPRCTSRWSNWRSTTR